MPGWSQGWEEVGSHPLAPLYPAGELVLLIYSVLLINHPQMHLTISWHLKIQYRSPKPRYFKNERKKKKKKKKSSNFCWLVKNLKDAIKSAFRFIRAARSQGRNVVLCTTRLLAAAAAVATSSPAAEVSGEAKGPGKFGKPVMPGPCCEGGCYASAACAGWGSCCQK